jgi:hypothetical protein
VKALTDTLQTIAVTLWAGGLWMTALLVWALFRAFPGVEAGLVAGRLFVVMDYTGMGCGLFLLLFRLTRCGGAAWKQLFFWLALCMLALTAAAHFGINPILQGLKEQAQALDVMNSPWRANFMKWHGISSLVYALECLLALGLVALHKAGK